MQSQEFWPNSCTDVPRPISSRGQGRSTCGSLCLSWLQAFPRGVMQTLFLQFFSFANSFSVGHSVLPRPVSRDAPSLLGTMVLFSIDMGRTELNTGHFRAPRRLVFLDVALVVVECNTSQGFGVPKGWDHGETIRKKCSVTRRNSQCRLAASSLRMHGQTVKLVPPAMGTSPH